eukprot:3983131-Alexandrium_andersonii.AAC.1
MAERRPRYGVLPAAELDLRPGPAARFGTSAFPRTARGRYGSWPPGGRISWLGARHALVGVA